MGVQKLALPSIKEYLEYEDASEIKHEYERGEILAMTGGTLNHAILCGNAYSEIRNGILKKAMPCTPFGSEARIHIAAVDSIVYPDTMVICGDMQVSDADKEAVINPLVIVEVLSKSTESYDRGAKFYKYQQLASFKEYLLIAQDQAVVDSFFKTENDSWEIARYSGLDTKLPIKSLGFEILLKELYVNVKWE